METNKFVMKIEEIEKDTNRGLNVKGTILSGTVELGDFLDITESESKQPITHTHIASIEKKGNNGFYNISTIAKVGDFVKLLITNSYIDNVVKTGQYITTAKQFK